MTHLHVVSFCPRLGSVTQVMTDHFIAHWQGSVSQRDLTRHPVPMMDTEVLNAYIKRNYHNETLALKPAGLDFWDTAANEAREADVLLVAAPIYNFSLPTPVHSWFDGLLQRGVGWDRIGDQYVGCLGPKNFVWIGSCGMVLGEEGESSYDLSRPWFRQTADFLGADISHCLLADGQARTGLREHVLQSRLQEAEELAVSLSKPSIAQAS